MYGTQTYDKYIAGTSQFENDVKMYGTQTFRSFSTSVSVFENDVKMYGTQTKLTVSLLKLRLRMM